MRPLGSLLSQSDAHTAACCHRWDIHLLRARTAAAGDDYVSVVVVGMGCGLLLGIVKTPGRKSARSFLWLHSIVTCPDMHLQGPAQKNDGVGSSCYRPQGQLVLLLVARDFFQ